MSCLVLDAMGVIFKAADDVAELLIPFIAEKSGFTDEEVVQSAYLEASLGKISPDEFWGKVGVRSALEDEFLSRHRLNPGVTELLTEAKRNNISVWCLSNDVSRWSEKIRSNLGVEEFLQGSVISGDVGIRKPDKAIYETLIQSSGYKIENILFVDDREKNVNAARDLGIETVMFKPETGFTDAKNWISRHAL
ncbi:MAG: HAD-IA family hydrolase [Gammaproteobacteria bacterium]